MLIKSPRHTQSDLQLWAEYERADRAHSHSSMLTRNYQRCVQLATAFINAGPCWAGVSWGKDSIVLAHMLLSINKRMPLRWIRVEPICNPDCVLVRDEFLKRHPDCDYAEEVVQCSFSDDEWHATGTLEAGSDAVCRQLGDRIMLGIRSEESGIRSLRVMRFGPNTDRRSAPLAYIGAKDVFALLYREQLPVHPAYACLGGGRWQRHHLRVSSLGGQRGAGMGRAEWEHEYYGDELRRMNTLPSHSP